MEFSLSFRKISVFPRKFYLEIPKIKRKFLRQFRKIPAGNSAENICKNQVEIPWKLYENSSWKFHLKFSRKLRKFNKILRKFHGRQSSWRKINSFQKKKNQIILSIFSFWYRIPEYFSGPKQLINLINWSYQHLNEIKVNQTEINFNFLIYWNYLFTSNWN